MGRRTHAQVEAAAIARERAGVVAFAREYKRQSDQLVEKGRVTAAEATLLNDRLRAFADGVATGLHVHGTDSPAIRAAVRDALATSESKGVSGQ